MNRADLLGVRPVWLVTLTVGGHVWRASSEPCDPVDSDGNPVPFDGGLADIEIDDSAEEFALDPTPPEASVSLLLAEDVAALVEEGLDLASGECEIALWAPGTSYESRMVLLVGPIDEPEYGEEGEPLLFSISPALDADTARLIDPREVISDATFANASDDSLGKVYPFVVGRPGVFVDETGATVYVPGSPAPLIRTLGGYTVIISDAEPPAGQVRIYDPDGGYDTLTPTAEVDLLGRTVSVVLLVLGGGTLDLTAQAFYCCWSASLASRAIESAGDVLRRVLPRSSRAIDRTQIAAVASRFDSYLLSGYSQDLDATPWGWCAKNVLPLLPVSVVLGPAGLQVIPWRFDASRDEAVAHLIEGEGFTRIAGPAYTRRDNINNRAGIACAVDGDGDSRYTRVHGPDPAEGATSLHAQTSGTRYGTRSAETETLSLVWDRATADLILSWRIRARAFPARDVDGEAGPDLLWLRPGDVVLLTSEAIHLTQRVGLVTAVSRRLDSVGLSIRLYYDPGRDPPGPQRTA